MLFRPGKTLKRVLWGVVALAAISVTGAIVMAVRDYAAIKEQVGALTTAVQLQNLTIEAQREALDDWEAWRLDQQRRLEELNDVSEEARRSVAELRQTFAGVDPAEMSDEELDAFVNSVARQSRCMLSAATGGNLDCSGDD